MGKNSIVDEECVLQDICIPEQTLTPYLRSLIGKQYDMGDGHIQTIIGYVDSETKKPRKRYVMECSVCSKDGELWYRGSILTDKSRLDNGTPSCGKAKRVTYTQNQKEVIFKRYLSKNNYTLLRAKNELGFWSARCNVCYENDPELWFDGVIEINDYNISTGRPSCGCCDQVPWKTIQYKILIARECCKRGYTLEKCGDNLTAFSEISLYNPANDIHWRTDVKSLLEGHCSREEYLLNKPKSGRFKDEVHIKRFFATGKFHKEYIFNRNNTKKNFKGSYDYWDCICPICSEDVYVQEGVSTGIFTTDTRSLKKGSLPCRCSKLYKYPYEEAKLLATITCNSYKGSFIEFVGEYKGIDSIKIKWERPDGIEAVANLRDIRKGKTGLNIGGFNPYKPARFYIVRWYGFCESYLKCGITNREVIERVSEQNKSSLYLDYDILHEFYHEDGRSIQNIERKYKETLLIGVCPKYLLPDGYTETTYDTEENLKLILNIAQEFLE